MRILVVDDEQAVRDSLARALELEGFQVSTAADGLAAAAVLMMGEGREQTPLALIEGAPVVFREKELTRKEIEATRIGIKDDLYAPLLTKVKWRKGGRGRK